MDTATFNGWRRSRRLRGLRKLARRRPHGSSSSFQRRGGHGNDVSCALAPGIVKNHRLVELHRQAIALLQSMAPPSVFHRSLKHPDLLVYLNVARSRFEYETSSCGEADVNKLERLLCRGRCDISTDVSRSRVFPFTLIRPTCDSLRRSRTQRGMLEGVPDGAKPVLAAVHAEGRAPSLHFR